MHRATSPGSEVDVCPICRDICSDKAFADNCFHYFCFVCLQEWAKIKAQCPMCKKPFQNIFHNIRTEDDYDVYKLKPSENGLFGYQNGQRFRYRTTSTAQRRQQWNCLHDYQEALRSSNQIGANRPLQIAVRFRAWIYQTGSRVLVPSDSTRVTTTSPQFYSENPAATHRLIPWLQREILVLLSGNVRQTQVLVDRICSLICQLEITSQQFLARMRLHFKRYAAHFVHEFYQFARSTCATIPEYDSQSRYNCPVMPQFQTASQDDDVMVLPSPIFESIGAPVTTSLAGPSSNDVSADELMVLDIHQPMRRTFPSKPSITTAMRQVCGANTSGRYFSDTHNPEPPSTGFMRALPESYWLSENEFKHLPVRYSRKLNSRTMEDTSGWPEPEPEYLEHRSPEVVDLITIHDDSNAEVSTICERRKIRGKSPIVNTATKGSIALTPVPKRRRSDTLPPAATVDPSSNSNCDLPERDMTPMPRSPSPHSEVQSPACGDYARFSPDASSSDTPDRFHAADGDIEILAEMKPKHLRTPELIDMVSDSELEDDGVSNAVTSRSQSGQFDVGVGMKEEQRKKSHHRHHKHDRDAGDLTKSKKKRHKPRFRPLPSTNSASVQEVVSGVESDDDARLMSPMRSVIGALIRPTGEFSRHYALHENIKRNADSGCRKKKRKHHRYKSSDDESRSYTRNKQQKYQQNHQLLDISTDD